VATDDTAPPSGPIADFAADLHRRAKALTFDLPFALQLETADDARAPPTQDGLTPPR
jgi:hypothetical protein